MLWTLIRDFFVQHVFGGTDSLGVSFDLDLDADSFLNDLTFPIGTTDFGEHSYYIGMSDWLSTTATIISITLIVIACALFVYKIIKLIGGLIR